MKLLPIMFVLGILMLSNVSCVCYRFYPFEDSMHTQNKETDLFTKSGCKRMLTVKEIPATKNEGDCFLLDKTQGE